MFQFPIPPLVSSTPVHTFLICLGSIQTNTWIGTSIVFCISTLVPAAYAGEMGSRSGPALAWVEGRFVSQYRDGLAWAHTTQEVLPDGYALMPEAAAAAAADVKIALYSIVHFSGCRCKGRIEKETRG